VFKRKKKEGKRTTSETCPKKKRRKKKTPLSLFPPLPCQVTERIGKKKDKKKEKSITGKKALITSPWTRLSAVSEKERKKEKADAKPRSKPRLLHQFLPPRWVRKKRKE